MGYVIARRIFKALLVCLTLLAIPLAIALVQVLVAFSRDKFPDNLYSTILCWFFLPAASLTGTLSITGALIFLLILTGIITAIGERRTGGVALKNYLRDVADKNSDLKPVGFSQQSALISVSVPLDEIFIRLHATTDRPRFDLPNEQIKHLEELRKRKDLTLEQREAELQALSVVWYSQMGSGLLEARQPQNIDVEYVVEQLTAKQPGAIMLGSPGSGKSTTMRWLAYHMAEEAQRVKNISWQVTWNDVLRAEMELGKSATYQSCLDLCLLVNKDNEQEHKAIALALQNALSLRDMQQEQARSYIISSDLRYLLDLRDLRDIYDLRDIRIFRGLRDLRGLRGLCGLRGLRDLREFLDFRDLRDLHEFHDYNKILHEFHDYNKILNELYSSLKQKSDSASIILLCIYSIITNNSTILLQHKEEIVHNLQELTNASQHTSTLEQRLLIKSIYRVLNPALASVQSPIIEAMTPDEKAKHIFAFQQQEALKNDDVEALLYACIDTRETTKETWQQLTGEDMTKDEGSPGMVGELAWKQLSHQWNMDNGARDVVIQKLDDENTIICAAAALMLQQSKHLLEDERKVAAQKIMRILRDEDLSRRRLDPPDYSKVWRLDDVLFETLGVLEE